MFKFVIGHVLADYVFQNDTMAVHKNRHSESELFKMNGFPNWFYWLSAHSIIHGAAVYIITQNMMLGLVEVVLHWIIDFCKCEKWFDIHIDQALHIICKAGYVYYLGGF